MVDPTAALVAIADAVQAVATPDPDVVLIRASERSLKRQLRALRLLRTLKARLAKLQASRGPAASGGRMAAIRSRIETTERLLTTAVLER